MVPRTDGRFRSVPCSWIHIRWRGFDLHWARSDWYNNMCDGGNIYSFFNILVLWGQMEKLQREEESAAE